MNTKTPFRKSFAVLTLIIGLLSPISVYVVPAAQADIVLVAVAITASPNTICAGQSSTLTWSSTDATSVSISPGIGAVAPFGEMRVSPTQTTTYTITGTNNTGGHGTATATVFVGGGSCPDPGTPTPTPTAGPVVLVAVAITASPGTICVGQSTRLTWSSTDATSITITPGIGSVTPFGERNVSPTQTTTYTITGTNSTGGHATATATVFVSTANDCAATPTPTPGSISIQKFGRNITRGGVSELSSVTIGANDTLEFTIRLRSLSSTTLNNVIVTDALPVGITYVTGSTIVNGNAASDAIVSAGLNIGSLVPGSETVVRFRAVVGNASTFPNGALTAFNIASVRADNTPTVSAQLPLTYGTLLRQVAGVKTGAAGTALMALLLSGILTFGYMAYTRTNIFARRDAEAAVKRALQDKQRLNFARFL